MSASLTQFLIDITRGPLKDAYVREPEAIAEAAPLPRGAAMSAPGHPGREASSGGKLRSDWSNRLVSQVQ